VKHQVKERQLLLRDELVRAALLGLKKATWRPIRPQPPPPYTQYVACPGRDGPGTARLFRGPSYPCLDGGVVRCPHGVPGDRLYVREAWNLRLREEWEDLWKEPIPKKCPDGYEIIYRADQEVEYVNGPWRPSIHMPRWASRILFRIEVIEVRRLQTITLEEIKLDGIRVMGAREKGRFRPMIRLTGAHPPTAYVGRRLPEWTEDDLFRAHFASGWDGSYYNEGYAWNTNPWCWHIKLKKLRGRKTDFPKQKVWGFGSREE